MSGAPGGHAGWRRLRLELLEERSCRLGSRDRRRHHARCRGGLEEPRKDAGKDVKKDVAKDVARDSGTPLPPKVCNTPTTPTGSWYSEASSA